jgi:hypothetical protein
MQIGKGAAMRAISYAAVHRHFPDKFSIPPEELYAWIGYPEYADNMYWENTCAVRMSMALLGVGIAISPGHMTVKAGKYKGRRIEQGQKRLSDFLVKALGKPEKFSSGGEAKMKIDNRRGIASFFQLHGPSDSQGHIDLVAPNAWNVLACESNGCYWSAVEVWFWPLK